MNHFFIPTIIDLGERFAIGNCQCGCFLVGHMLDDVLQNDEEFSSDFEVAIKPWRITRLGPESDGAGIIYYMHL